VRVSIDNDGRLFNSLYSDAMGKGDLQVAATIADHYIAHVQEPTRHGGLLASGLWAKM